MFTDYYTFLEVEQQVMIFKMGKSQVAVELKYVKKVELVGEILPLPRSPPGVEGIVRIDGDPYPLLKLEKLVNIETEDSEAIIVMLLNTGDSLYGIQLSSLPYAAEKVVADEKQENIAIPEAWIAGFISLDNQPIPLLNPQNIWTSLGVE